MPILVFDNDCALCTSLAQFVSQRARIEIQSWADYRLGSSVHPLEINHKPGSKQLIIIDAGIHHVGVDAWEWLLLHYRDLAALSWLAQRLHLTRTAAASMQSAAYRTRKWCHWCRPW